MKHKQRLIQSGQTVTMADGRKATIGQARYGIFNDQELCVEILPVQTPKYWARIRARELSK